MDLPQSVQAYFDADAQNDAEALARAFAPDARVADEGRTYAGRAKIEAWWRDAKAKSQAVSLPLEADHEPARTRVRARVVGDFPGSPIVLMFDFRLADGLIQSLEIAP